jgi:hypothetical protein
MTEGRFNLLERVERQRDQSIATLFSIGEPSAKAQSVSTTRVQMRLKVKSDTGRE